MLGGVRMACNRDESPLRPPAAPPVRRAFGRHEALLPIDPASGGTWIAANDAGLMLTLLNAYSRPWTPGDPLFSREGKRSRGAIIPSLLDCGSVAAAVSRVALLAERAREYQPFRLVIVDADNFADVRGDGETLTIASAELPTEPLLFTSSGLGDALVEPPRRELFETIFARGADWVEAQRNYHRHSWPDRGEISVCMRREVARTVSYSEVTAGPGGVSMIYHAGPPDEASASMRSELPCGPTSLPLCAAEECGSDRCATR